MADPNDSDLPFLERPDLSPFLVHLTKNTVEVDGYTAYDNLVSILRTGEVFGSTTRTGFIKGSNAASCFMDVPLHSLKYVLNASATDRKRPRYEPFGIVVTKRRAYEMGCRPVMYLSNEELEAIGVPDEELWRVVRLEAVDGTGVNWLHEREWRCKGSYPLSKKVIAVLVQTNREAVRLRNAVTKSPDIFKAIPGSIIPLEVLCQGLPYLAAE